MILLIVAIVGVTGWASASRVSSWAAGRYGRGGWCVYLLRDGRGVPLYLGSTGDFARRFDQHKADPEPWRRTISRDHSTVVRYCWTERAARRIELRRIRALTLPQSFDPYLVPRLENEIGTGPLGTARRIWLRPWLWAYRVESWAVAARRWHEPVRAARSGPSMSPTEAGRPADRDGLGRLERGDGPGTVGGVFALVAPRIRATAASAVCAVSRVFGRGAGGRVTAGRTTIPEELPVALRSGRGRSAPSPRVAPVSTPQDRPLPPVPAALRPARPPVPPLRRARGERGRFASANTPPRLRLVPPLDDRAARPAGRPGSGGGTQGGGAGGGGDDA